MRNGNGIGVMRAQSVQTMVVEKAGHNRGNGLPRSIPMLFLMSESTVTVGGELSWGSAFCAETPHGCHLHPVRRTVEGGSKQENSGVFGSRRETASSIYTRGQQGHRVQSHQRCRMLVAPGPVVEYVTPAPTVYEVYASPAPVVEYSALAPAVCAAPFVLIASTLAVYAASVVEYIAPALA